MVMAPHNTRCGSSARAKRVRNRCDGGNSCCDARLHHRAENCSTAGFHGRRSWSCDDSFTFTKCMCCSMTAMLLGATLWSFFFFSLASTPNAVCRSIQHSQCDLGVLCHASALRALSPHTGYDRFRRWLVCYNRVVDTIVRT